MVQEQEVCFVWAFGWNNQCSPGGFRARCQLRCREDVSCEIESLVRAHSLALSQNLGFDL